MRKRSNYVISALAIVVAVSQTQAQTPGLQSSDYQEFPDQDGQQQ